MIYNLIIKMLSDTSVTRASSGVYGGYFQRGTGAVGGIFSSLLNIYSVGLLKTILRALSV